MFRTITKHTTTTIAALIALGVAASACGGQTAASPTAGALPGAVDTSPVDAEAVPATTTSDESVGGAPSDTGVSAVPAETSDPTSTPRTEGESDEPGRPTNDTGADDTTPADDGEDHDDATGDPAPGNDNPGPLPPADLGTVHVSAPELHYARACFAHQSSLTWTADGVNEYVLDDRRGNLIAVREVRHPLTVTRDDNGGPLFAEHIETTIDENRGFFLEYEVNGTLGDIDVSWASNTAATGIHNSPVFHSRSNPACFAQVGFRIAVDDQVPSTPQRPDLDDVIDPVGTAEHADTPEADFEVAVRKVKIDAAANCFAGDLPSRVFDTGSVPVTVVVDTHGVSETQAITTHHQGTTLTDELRQLAISERALRAPANRDEGYDITVQLQGFLTGGIVIEWVVTASEPGRQTSPTFSSPAGDCDVTINFTVVEID